MEVMNNESLPDFVGRMAEEHWRARLRVAELEAVAYAARAYEQAVREEASFRECGRLFGTLTDTLDALDKEKK